MVQCFNWLLGDHTRVTIISLITIQFPREITQPILSRIASKFLWWATGYIPKDSREPILRFRVQGWKSLASNVFPRPLCPDLASSVTHQSRQVTLAGYGCPLPYPYCSGHVIEKMLALSDGTLLNDQFGFENFFSQPRRPSLAASVE